MNIIAVDDEKFPLQDLKQAVAAAIPTCSLTGFSTPSDALSYAEKHRVDVAFLDVEMHGMNGLVLAKKLKDIYGETNVIFVTGHSDYAVDAFSVAASGYILKPVSVEEIKASMERLRNPIATDDVGVRVQTFGNFEVFVDGQVLHFPRSKSKELFAYLIHKRGTGCTLREIIAVLYEDQEITRSLQNQAQTIIATMVKVFDSVEKKGIIKKKFNNLSVETSMVNCDYYKFLQWDVDAVNAYTGEYMANYSWAEFTVGYLDRKVL